MGGGNKAARAEETRATKVLVESRTSPTPKTDRRVNQTVASWRMVSAAQGLQATPPTANGFKPQLPRRSYASRWTPQPNIYICEHHKNVIQTVRTKRKRRESEDSTEEQQQQQGTSGASASNPPLRQGQGDMVDLFQLQMNTLRRYKNHFKVTSRPGLNKAQLADSLSRHFHSLPVVEKEAITYFLYMIKTGQSRLDPQGGKAPY